MAASIIHTGVLGINGRNLLYIKPLNDSKAIRFADDKLKTKGVLSARGIPAPKFFSKITSPEELEKFKWETLPTPCVLKPNAGYGGQGIIVFETKEKNAWISKSKKRYSVEDIKKHIRYILRGEFSITGTPDIAFFEQKIECHEALALFSKFGLPDIRIIVFNLVPVMAMLRVPTRESKGKANLHSGGIGIGIDLAKGETTLAIQKKGKITRLPDSGEVIAGKKIPFWDQILLIASQIQTMSTLGYLAVDIALDKQGPVLLEINARAGLSVQNANGEGLRSRLERIKNVKVISPEKGVRLAQDLFGNKVEKEMVNEYGKQVIGLEEEAEITLKQGGTKKLFARIDANETKNFVEEEFFRKIAGNQKSAILDFKIRNTRSRGMFYPAKLKNTKHQAIIGGKILNKFLLDPTIKPPEQQISASPRMALQKADEIICGIDRKISLINATKPTNLAEEKTKFMGDPNYNPHFQYLKKGYPFKEFRDALKNLKLHEAPLGTLLAHKRSELLTKLDTIEAIGNDEKFTEAACKLFGKPGEKIIETAQLMLKNMKRKKTTETLESAEKLGLRCKELLETYGITDWKIIYKDSLTARFTIGKKNSLLIKKDAVFSENEIRKILAHEIETHVLTTLNGRNQPYKIFERGLAGYLETQEGLAIYHQESVFPLKQNINIAVGTILADMTLKKTFRDLYNFALKYVDEETAWQLALKAKRGMVDTEKKGGFPKNHLYLQGCLKIKDFLSGGGKLEDIFLGKIALDQLSIVKTIKEIRPPKYLPRSIRENTLHQKEKAI